MIQTESVYKEILIFRRLSSAPRGSIVASHLSLNVMDRKESGIIDEEDSTPLWNALKEMVNLELLVDPIFILVGTSNIFGMLGFYVPFVYLPNMAEQRGVAVEDANFLLSIIGKLKPREWDITRPLSIE